MKRSARFTHINDLNILDICNKKLYFKSSYIINYYVLLFITFTILLLQLLFQILLINKLTKQIRSKTFEFCFDSLVLE